jgi:hypothetical protein
MMHEIEKAFEATTSLLLGAPLTGIRQYESFLLRHVGARAKETKSRLSGKKVYFGEINYFTLLNDNVVTVDESLELGRKRKITESQADSLSVENASAILSGVKTTTPEIVYGKNINTQECACYGPTSYCFRSTFTWFCKLAAYSYWPKRSECVFGCSNVLDSKFDINCYGSTNLTRCFETSDSSSCTDCYFCHNVENCNECMFCFNTKGKRYAIANREVGREKYMEIKKRILAQVHGELSATKNLKYDIYTLGVQQQPYRL